MRPFYGEICILVWKFEMTLLGFESCRSEMTGIIKKKNGKITENVGYERHKMLMKEETVVE